MPKKAYQAPVIHTVGSLSRPLSDLAAVALGGHIVLAGGRDSSGRVQDAILRVTATSS